MEVFYFKREVITTVVIYYLLCFKYAVIGRLISLMNITILYLKLQAFEQNRTSKMHGSL